MKSSTSRIAARLSQSPKFWERWLRQPALDAAESILRLRRLRGMSQAELAVAVGSKQPAIARMERGRTNISTSTLVKFAEALGSTVRIQMEPLEEVRGRTCWWEHGENKTAASYNVNVHITVVALGVSAGEFGLAEDIPDAEFSVVDGHLETVQNKSLLPAVIS